MITNHNYSECWKGVECIHAFNICNTFRHGSLTYSFELFKVLRIDHESDASQYSDAYGPPSDHYDNYQQYYREPEPIIEIIIKESNETLPAPPPPPVQHIKPTKEPVHVFYVKYKKNPKGKGEDDIIYEAPVPALTPPTDEIEEEPHVPEVPYEAATLPPVPPPSTTLRTIIHPDSEVFHGGNLKVTFGETEVKGGDAAYGESNSPTPSVALPHKEAQNRESSPSVNTHGSIKRQGTYHTIPQEVYDQNPPKASPSSLTPTFQVPNGNFQQNTLRQQNVQHQQLQQQQKVNFPRQAPNPQQLPFRPQHTSAIFNNQQQSAHQFNSQQQQALQTPHHQQQYNPRPQFQQPAANHQRQAQRQQSNQFPSSQNSGQNLQQRPQFRQSAQQFDQRPVQYSQPLNTPQQPQRPQTLNQQDAQRFHQQHQQQPQPSQILRNQPINVPNQDFARYNQQQFPTSQPVNTPVPLPSKPIHPQFVHLYQQQINLAQQNSQSFVPSTHQPHQANLPQITQPLPTNQQQYRFSQPVVNIPQPSTSQPLPAFHHSTPSPQVSSVKNQAIRTVFPNFEGGEVIKSISQSEEHLRPQYEQPSKIQQPSPQPTVEQLNQLNQLRNQQQINQLNQQLQNQQSINQQLNQQLYLQQQSLHQRQQQIQNDFSSNPSPKSNHQRTSQYSHPNQIVSTTSQPVKSTTPSYQTKYSQVYSQTPSSTPVPTAETPTSTTEDPKKAKEKEIKFKENLAALPDEVPDDIREQLLSSGILGNADISILDYDKVGDIPIESLPPEALENFYGAGSAPVPAVAIPDPPSPDNTPAESKGVEMKVVHYDPASQEGQKVEDTYIKDDATQVDSVILNDSKYNRYLPLKVSGSNFPLPDASILAGKKVNSVVVLAPVDYDFVKQAEEEDEREGRSGPVQVQGVRFIAGSILKNLIKDPTPENYKSWLSKEKSIPSDRQSVVLLVVS